jgi:phosphatidylserine/phosphatidylglycerophosphate/cardiolipin synthase-like enzyme
VIGPWLVDISVSEPTAISKDAPLASMRRNRVTLDNHVDVLIDGHEYMRRWFHEANALTKHPDPHRCWIHHSAWRLENVGPEGRLTPSEEMLFPTLNRAFEAGVPIRIRLSGHAMGLSSLKARRNLPKGVYRAVDGNLRSLTASQHDKVTVFGQASTATALCGSIDLSTTRWDTNEHLIVSTRRFTVLRPPSHDIGVAVTGGAALDLDLIQRKMFTALGVNDAAFQIRNDDVATIGSAVQVLRTVPVNRKAFDETTEFSLAAAYWNAVGLAKRYIYIEDQYFWPAIRNRQPGFDVDLLDILLDRIRQGVDVIVVLPSARTSSPITRLQTGAREQAIAALVAAQRPGSGRVSVVTPIRNRRPVYVHSKLLLVDDEYCLIGSANLNGRSMFHDSEVGLGIADRHVTVDARARLWEEHLGIDREALRDCEPAIELWFSSVSTRRGNVRPYLSKNTRGPEGTLQQALWSRLIDPAGRSAQ